MTRSGVALALALFVPTGAMGEERQEVGRARAVASLSNRALGTVRLEFRTLAPGPNVAGITGTIQQQPGDPWVIHRILIDTARGLYYGYDIALSRGEQPGQVVAAVRALAAEVEAEFRQTRWRDFCRECSTPRPVATAPQRFPEPRAVGVGDTLVIDLLADESSGGLVTDRVTFAAPRRAPSEVVVLPPRDLTADAVHLQMAEPTLRVNGRPAWSLPDGSPPPDRAGSVQGDVLWTELPRRGRVFLSLAPHAGYPFEKSGVVAGDRITFEIAGDRYEWISQGPIATAGPVPPFQNVQSWHVWVLHDPGYRPSREREGGAGAGFDERAENRLKRP
jgi:hypothetical protein